jgi:hypothetical protein
MLLVNVVQQQSLQIFSAIALDLHVHSPRDVERPEHQLHPAWPTFIGWLFLPRLQEVNIYKPLKPRWKLPMPLIIRPCPLELIFSCSTKMIR